MQHVRAANSDASTFVQPGALTFCGLLLLSATGAALGQTSPAQGPLPTASMPSVQDDREMADYLGLLQRIAPASEAGARTYVAAVRLRCGQALDAAALRRVMAREGGDPVLMGLIRAAATQDRTARDQAVAQLQCPREERR